jgi:prepilin-type N-terminal cleavage/methylation domain-containing protein
MRNSGLSLLEVSVVLIIIGLIVGGIVTGQDLINAAAQRAQIAQIDKYNTAAHVFQNKYNGWLPGDIPNPDATNYGLQTRGTYTGEGDGNNLIQSIRANADYSWDGTSQSGETAMFWVDLSTAGLIEAGFNTATPTSMNSITLTNITSYLPQAKIKGNYVYVWSGGYAGISAGTRPVVSGDGLNYFGILLTNGTSGGWGCSGTSLQATTGMTVIQAYNIDKKIDDGLPQSG